MWNWQKPVPNFIYFVSKRGHPKSNNHYPTSSTKRQAGFDIRLTDTYLDTKNDLILVFMPRYMVLNIAFVWSFDYIPKKTLDRFDNQKKILLFTLKTWFILSKKQANIFLVFKRDLLKSISSMETRFHNQKCSYLDFQA